MTAPESAHASGGAAPAHVPVAPEHGETAPIGGRLVTRFTAVLALLVVVLVAVLAVRFVRGIGAVTNLSDGYPWGIWIAYDVVVGTALGASGFTVAFVTYILHRGSYHPMVRPALLTALFGYLMAAASVVFDIGRYWEAWHIFLPGYVQFNSVLAEVALCIMAYTVVLFIEFLPAVLERFGLRQIRDRLDRVLFVFIALGVLLPTMHQSSLGSMLLVFGPQIDPLYQTRWLPVLFLTSTIGMGLAAVVVEGSVSALALRRPLERGLLGQLMKVGTAMIAAFLVVRFADLAHRGVVPLLLQPTTVAIMFWIETALFTAPLVVMWGEAGTRPGRFFVAAMALAIAGMLYRIDAYLVAYHTGAGWHYFPSLGELAVSIGLVAFEILAFILAIRLLPVLTRPSPRPSPRAKERDHG
jgi:Ni/Fe-hydrogenase subunit HybB-like protein